MNYPTKHFTEHKKAGFVLSMDAESGENGFKQGWLSFTKRNGEEFSASLGAVEGCGELTSSKSDDIKVVPIEISEWALDIEEKANEGIEPEE